MEQLILERGGGRFPDRCIYRPADSFDTAQAETQAAKESAKRKLIAVQELVLELPGVACLNIWEDSPFVLKELSKLDADRPGLKINIVNTRTLPVPELTSSSITSTPISTVDTELLVQTFLRKGHSLEDVQLRYGVTCTPSRGTSLVRFKYSTAAGLSCRLASQCRGLILDSAKNWSIVARPFDRFFNHQEPCAPALDWSTTEVYEKADGTLMMMYWWDGAWHVGTAGSAEARGLVGSAPSRLVPQHKNAGSHGVSFQWLFWDVFQRSGYRLPQGAAAREMTFLFELVGEVNRVMVCYGDEALLLLGARHRTTGDELTPEDANLVASGKTSAGYALASKHASAANSSLQDCLATFSSIKKPIAARGFCRHRCERQSCEDQTSWLDHPSSSKCRWLFVA